VDLLTSKDIWNIKNAYNIEIVDGKRHPNDATSVDLWVEECYSKDTEYNPVLFYKRQGDVTETYGLEKHDFCLIVMNKSQKVMFKEFGNNILAVDGTHGLNGYDFELTTLMVIDEFRQGFPVAFMFSNRKDTFVYKLFFQTIKSAVGTVDTRIFMSDMAEEFYNAWLLTMGSVPHHLFCAWHVDRAWQKNLNKIKMWTNGMRCIRP
jgi:hypothetical protein